MSRHFNGTTQSLSRTTPVTTAVNTDVTISAWVNSEETSTAERIAVTNGHGSGAGYSIGQATGRWEILCGLVGRLDSGVTVVTGVWKHLLATMVGATHTWQIYVNGVAAGSSGVLSPSAPSGGFDVGRQNEGGSDQRFWLGQIAQVAVWDRVLSSAEISALAAGATASVYAPTAYYKITGTDNPELEAAGGTSLTLNNAPPAGASDPVIITPSPYNVELELSGRDNGWTDVTNDVLRYEGITASGGMTSGSVTERIAATGEMTFALNNSAKNSAHLLGYYSPGHVNCRAGFSIGIGVRWRATFGSNAKTLFTGRVDIIKPVAGQHGSRRTFVTAVDYMDELAQAKLHGLAVQVNQYPGDVFTTVVNSLPRQPRALEVDQGVDTMAYSLDSARDESQTAMEEAAKLAASEHGFIYQKGDGTLTFEGRSRRATHRTNLATFVDMTALDLTYQRDRALNDVQVTVHPKRADSAATTVLASLQSATKLVPGQTFTWLSPYRDPQQIAARVGGTDMVTPAANTDYVMNGAQDGTGADLTAACSIVANFGGNGVRLEVTNTGSVDGYIGGTAGIFQVRGRGLYDFENVILEQQDTTAQTNIGVVTVGVDMPYQSRLDVGAEIALYVLQTQTAAFATIDKMAFIASTSTLQQQVVLREIGDRIGLQETVTGIDASGAIPRGYFIQGKRYQLIDTVLSVEFALAIADSTAYWLLEIQGFSELDQTTRLGFGLIIGHIDIAHQDSATVAHSDTAHGDVPHGDSLHVDSSHGDVTHSDVAHVDTPHSDVAHSDTAHTDVAHVDSSQHDDHNDSMGGHNDTGGGRTHTDTAHVDTPHGDQAAVSFGASYNHTDGTSHIDVPNHSDGYEHFDAGGYHNDVPFVNVSFVNTAHGDNTHEDFADHNDSAHSDVAHVDTHGDSAHVDSAHSDVAHVDNSSHGDQAAQSTSHTDVAHIDIAAAPHGDSPHGDAN